eukprot:5635836-Pleurochrysis_carterae.AAC.5
MYNGTNQPGFNPKIQIVDVKKIANNGGDRHRLVISDGQHLMQAMLATQLNHLVEQGQAQTCALYSLSI